MHFLNRVIAYGRDFDEYSTIFSSNQAVNPKAFGCFVVAGSSSACGWGTTRAEPLKPRLVDAAETGRRPSVRLRGLPIDSLCPKPERLDVLLPPAIFVLRACSRGARVCAVSSLCCGCPVAFCAALRLVASIALLASSSGAAIAARCPSAAPALPSAAPARGVVAPLAAERSRPTAPRDGSNCLACPGGLRRAPCRSQESMRLPETSKGLVRARTDAQRSLV